MTPVLWLGLLAVLLVVAAVAGVYVWRNRSSRRSVAPPLAPTPQVGVRGPAGSAPDYALTGDYYPKNYWAVYWPLGSNGEVETINRAHVLGGGLLAASRGPS